VGKEQEMTRKERHIAVLNRMLENMDVYDSIQPTTERKKAIKAAIQALEQNESAEEWYKLFVEKLDEQEPTDAISRIRKRMWNCRGKHTTSIDKVKMEQIIRDELSVTQKSIECEDAVSRKKVEEITWDEPSYTDALNVLTEVRDKVRALPSVTQKSGKCKNCKYFEYDSVAKVDGIPLIVAHEICNKWGGGCKTSEDGYCYLYEPQESEE
jgi:CRISPR/Cas system-associated exonuclease Cas4 (RecB family)